MEMPEECQLYSKCVIWFLWAWWESEECQKHFILLQHKALKWQMAGGAYFPSSLPFPDKDERRWWRQRREEEWGSLRQRAISEGHTVPCGMARGDTTCPGQSCIGANPGHCDKTTGLLSTANLIRLENQLFLCLVFSCATVSGEEVREMDWRPKGSKFMVHTIGWTLVVEELTGCWISYLWDYISVWWMNDRLQVDVYCHESCPGGPEWFPLR